MTGRRQFLRGSALAATAGFLGFNGTTRGAQGQQPNVVFLISDDQAWTDYGFMGHPQIETPRLDRLAGESLTFTRGYVAAPLCCPSLASMITGLHPHQNGITCNDATAVDSDVWKWTPERLKMRFDIIANIDRVATVPGILGNEGYLSMQTGKWWLGNYRRGDFTHGMTHGDPERGGRHGDDGLDIGRKGIAPIAEFLDTAGDRPFFLWYAPMLPHTPHTPPDRLFEKYSKRTDSEHVAKYWAMCEFFDETCGELLDLIDARGLTDNTVVLYMCDNGWIQDPKRNGYAPRSKRTCYEGGVRTPIMVRWPGKVAPKRDDQTLVSVIDVVPTALAACGVAPTMEMQGLNLLDQAALDARGGVCGAQYVHTALDNHDAIANLQHLWCLAGEWKLIVPAGNAPADTEEVQLFNVANDPTEEKNLAAENPEKVKELSNRLQEWWPEGAKTARV